MVSRRMQAHTHCTGGETEGRELEPTRGTNTLCETLCSWDLNSQVLPAKPCPPTLNVLWLPIKENNALSHWGAEL